MRLQPFHSGNPHNIRAKPVKTLFRKIHNGRFLDKIVHRKGGKEPGRPAGRQGMVGARQVVTGRLRSKMAEKNGPGISDPWQQFKGVAYRQFQMLRSNFVGKIYRFIQVIRNDDRPVILPGFPGYLLPGKALELPFHLCRNLFAEFPVNGNKDRRCQFIMFSLREKVGGDMSRTAGTVADHQYLARPRDHVYPHLPEYQLFGGSNIDIPRTGNLVHPGNGCSTVGECRYRLGSADPEYPVNSGERSSHQDMMVYLSIRGRNNHYDFVNPCHPGRNGIHDHTGRIACLAPGDINPYSLERGNLLPKQDIFLTGGYPAFLLLPVVKQGHPFHRQLERFYILILNPGKGLVYIIFIYFQSSDCFTIQPIEAAGVVKDCLIATLAHIGDYLLDDLLTLPAGLFAPAQNGGKFLIKILVFNIEELHPWPHRYTNFSNPSMISVILWCLVFRLPRLTIRRVVISAMVSTSTSPFCRKVSPVETRSTR